MVFLLHHTLLAPRKNEWVSKNAVMRLVADLVEVGNKNWTC